MHIIFLCFLIVSSQDFHSVKSDGISSKLDFGDDAEKIITIKTPEQFTHYEISKPEGTTVICSNSGCNKTETNKQEGIVSDVLVHVKTSVNVPKIKNETIEETPDIPVVLGYGRNNPHPQYNPDNLVNTNPIRPIENDFPQNTFVPIYQRKPQPTRKFYNNYKQVSYDTNMLYIPYIEPSFHNYHYGEQPPLQYVWTPKDGAGLNPVEFKRFERPALSNKVQYSQWNGRPINSASLQGTTTGYTMCTCQNPGLNWYPTTPTWNLQPRHVKSHIDDKLASLN